MNSSFTQGLLRQAKPRKQVKTKVAMDRRAAQTISAAVVLACAWPALLLATVCLLPYLNKPFINDDPWFLTMAQQIAKRPMHPAEFDICWTARRLLEGDAGKCLDWRRTARLRAGAGSSGWRPRVDGTRNAARVRLDCDRCDGFHGPPVRVGPKTRNRRRAAFGGYRFFSSHGQQPYARYACDGTRASCNGTPCRVEGRTEIEPGRSRGCRTGPRRLCASTPCASSAPCSIFFAGKRRTQGVVVAVPHRSRLWTPVFAGCGILLAIIAITSEHDQALKPLAPMMGLENVSHNLLAYLLYLLFPIPLTRAGFANR